MTLLRSLLFMAFALAAAVLAGRADAFETRARNAWVYDITTGTVLLDKGGDEPVPPASMSKLMTVNMLFEALRDGRVSLEDRFAVSTRAKDMGGSTMFLNETDRPTVEDLIKGIVVLSGNDACVVVAEGLAGTEEDFARKMNERAKALGMDHSTFANASGWPHPNQRMSMSDLGHLAVRLITEFPEYYGYFAIQEFPFDNRAPDNRHNRNPLLKLGIGADGLKTGHTEEAGFGLVGSAMQGGRRIVFAVSGLESDRQRAEEAERIVSWAFREFVQKTVAKAGTRIADAPVWMGAKSQVGLVVQDDLTLLLPSLAQDNLKAEVSYASPIEAPVAAGSEVARMTIEIPGHEPVIVPLVAEEAVAKGGFATRIKTAFGILSTRAMSEFAN
ncbi:MAG: D-alanyl-D-alanine carboxypeptidase [Rhodobacteraceae bacterium]|uniref:D-alanyl-D-alanine carboxypeptidase family protein n=1 Tax=Albidovulum sp. TaxID=1872424 RepID=UPI001DF1A518|nr:D-alanyl-D-alanine carboxypeptidase [Paracoccaceae bacterium]HPE24752.1 D-alanyl-D-alanine carboxypeptidase family protein [Albidovulum sp.]MCB2132108.1 D-alanyl-D-alanine carboxypeptidase [Paracoccaceae bacterium]MCB2138517.1 D-alanyl-D-alanine carboxypeptidase [Paracoccaceae bacterium]MCB2143316.1 D-alanyl-D-alanine carboxypeptidase [Paracoccaceae bacterium]